jgi:hypothetical protein
MFNSPKTLMVTMGIVLVLGLYYFEINKLSKEFKEPNPACRKTDIIRVKPGIIERTEEDGKLVYVTEKWNAVMTGEKDEIGYWLALCKSPDEYVEIRDAGTGDIISKYEIDMHYRMTHGLPMNQ